MTVAGFSSPEFYAVLAFFPIVRHLVLMGLLLSIF